MAKDPAAQRDQRLKRQFNITSAEYDAILAHQGGVCAICKQPPKPGTSLAVDHDHETGLVRGLLCSWCNRGIAAFRDDLEKFKAIVAYFTSSPATEALGAARYGRPGRVGVKKKTLKKLVLKAFIARAVEYLLAHAGERERFTPPNL